MTLTVWDSPASLLRFLQHAHHRAVSKRYGSLFEESKEATVALWWIPEEATPDLIAAEERLLYLRDYGPTPLAFDLATAFDYPAPRPRRA
ncbi:MAG TPA: DUF3291 domain-containing protein [Verrucomicrobiae bacterium]|nr:DUF3291 domain-containing protein [Verrucomicrobiae bacterium]